jgi:hypothetical protein
MESDTIFIGAYDDNTEESFESIVALEDSINSKLQVIQIYTAWGSQKDQVFPLLRAQAIYELGSIPLISWEPWLDDFDAKKYPALANLKNKNTGGLKEIASGRFDDYIDKWAKEAKKFGSPFYLRLGHEMNDPYRYPWGPQNNKPKDFIAAWQHIVTRFKEIGATNAIWIWSPHPAYTDYAQYYPGHDYVDWIGVTTLNYGSVAPWSKWYSFDEIFGKCYNELSLYNKPMMITEIGSLDVGGNKAEWFEAALDSIPVKHPSVKAVVFFHVNSDNSTTYKALDWSLESDSAVKKAISSSLSKWNESVTINSNNTLKLP